MSKKIKFLIIVLSIIIFIGLFFGITSIVKFCKLQNLYSKTRNNLEFDNYYLKTTVKTNKEPSTTEAYYRNNVGKLIAENGVYTWADGKNAYLIDEENKKTYVLDVNNYNGLVSYEMFLALVPGYNKSIFEKFLLAGDIKTTIKSKKIEENKYIEISYTENKIVKKTLIEEKTMKPVKMTIEFFDGTIYTCEYELKFNTVKLKDIELPEMENYEIIDAKTGEIIVENFNAFNNSLDEIDTKNVDSENRNNVSDNIQG